MFKALTQNLTNIFERLKRSGVLSEAQIDEAMRGIRIALLEADVSLSVVKDFIEIVKEKAKGQEIIRSVLPGQMVVKIIHEAMINILSSSIEERALNFKTANPANILMVGLQGSGKTTASAKLALKLSKQNKKILLVSLDIYRPAAQMQLAILAKAAGVNSLEIVEGETPIQITNRAHKIAKLSGYEVVIYDTAGRLHINDELMQELTSVKEIIHPIETLLVVDSLIGQDAVIVATNFKEKIGLTGVILSRIDGDGRGGAALSIKYVTKTPIKFLSSGEKLDSLEEFDPERIASRILDMGDVISLVEKASSILDEKESEKMAAKIKKGNFDLNDYISQLKSIKKLGGISSIIGMIPGMGKFTNALDPNKVNEKLFIQQEAIILSMTKKERINPDILNASRRVRIAKGAGSSVQQVNILIKQFKQIKDMMKKTSKIDPKNMTPSRMGKFFS